MPLVEVPRARLVRWVANFGERHGGVELMVSRDGLGGTAPDGSTFRARLPFDVAYDGPPDVDAFAAAVTTPARWGVLLVRRGGFAVARLEGPDVVAQHVGRRHVQGRTKAGGQSQQRFARRRANQARVALDAAADHAARVLGRSALPIVVGGDRAAVREVLADPRLARLRVCGGWLPVPDPTRAVLLDAVARAGSVRIDVDNASDPGPGRPIR